MTFWEVDILGVDILRVDILGVDILGVDILGVDILGRTLSGQTQCTVTCMRSPLDGVLYAEAGRPWKFIHRVIRKINGRQFSTAHYHRGVTSALGVKVTHAGKSFTPLNLCQLAPS